MRTTIRARSGLFARSWLYAGTVRVPWLEAFTGLHTSPAEAEVFVVAFENLWMAKTRDASLSAVRDRGRSGGLVPGPGAVLVIAAVVRRVIVTARFLMPLTPVG